MAEVKQDTTPKRMEDSHGHLVDPSDNLRKVEIDVVIPKMMKTAAMKTCDGAVRAFTECCRNRTVSILWACRDVNKQLDECLRANLTDADFVREKANFIKLRAAHTAKGESVPTNVPMSAM